MKPTTDFGVATLPDGARLHYSIAGAIDAPLLLLNRPLGGSMDLWGEFEDKLAESFRVLAFDPRGVGRSSDLPLTFGTRDMARDVVTLMDTLSLRRAHVFGLSLGGMVASWLAADAGERVERLVLASTLPNIGTVSSHVVLSALPLLGSFTSPGVDAEVRLVRNILSSDFRKHHPDRLHAIERSVREQPATRRNLLLLALAAARHRTSPSLIAKHPPALLLFGEWDRIARERSEAELLRDLPNAELAIVPRSGHDLSLEQPVVTAERVVAFLNK
ncbi:MAG TPA: alpha/beta hydrolase [Polyangiaceae bacterium]|nr:alpha/beta hydrolase [Polyangiaceae bacterium]